MLLIALLLVSLACLVAGLILASAVWLVASLVVSVLAGYLLWRQRERMAARAGVHKNQSAPTSTPTKPQQLSDTAHDTPASPGSAQPADPAMQVWVVDGRPQFHEETCQSLDEVEGKQPIPLAQAHEDGFTECLECTPLAPPRHQAEQVVEVWVVDGRPDYHVADCKSLKAAAGQSDVGAEPIPRPQAVHDGFSPCPDCRPDGMPAEPRGPEGTVWVIDGRPRYHLSDCLIIKDQDAEEIPRDQATADGFMACSMCEPDAARV